jgi:3-dehydroquinate synthase
MSSRAGVATRIPVGGEAPYDVLVGTGLLDDVAGLVGEGVRTTVVVHPAAVAVTAADLRGRLADAGLRAELLAVPDGESAKNAAVIEMLWAEFARLGVTRSDAVVSVGGGATTDAAGFAAATWLRGVRVVHVPTTLLGMVDAAVGGKTGINTAAGKNLVGAFHPPAGVVCDLDLLASLPAAEITSGLAEVVKAGFIADPVILDLIEADPHQAADPAAPLLPELVERAVRVKADVVGRDLRESGLRQALNYGHTLGHAIERVEGFGWRHGAAISVGMVYAAVLARRTGRLETAIADRHAAVLGALDLPVRYQAGAWSALHDAMRVDKKARGDRLRFVVLDGLARPAVVDAPAADVLEAAYTEVSATAGATASARRGGDARGTRA